MCDDAYVVSPSLAKRAGVAIVQRSAGREPGTRQNARGESARVRMRDREGTRKSRERLTLIRTDAPKRPREECESVRFIVCVPRVIVRERESERELSESAAAGRRPGRRKKESSS